MMRPLILTTAFLVLAAVGPIGSLAADDARTVEIAYASATGATVLIYDEGDPVAGVGPVTIVLPFQSGEKQLWVTVADATGIPIGSSWMLADVSSKSSDFTRGHYCGDLNLVVPDDNGTWVAYIHLPHALRTNACTNLPHAVTGGTIRATFS